MNDKNNIQHNKSLNKSKIPINATTKKNYYKKNKYLEIKDYTNINKVTKQIDIVANLGTRKSSCNALIHFYNSHSTSIFNSYKPKNCYMEVLIN